MKRKKWSEMEERSLITKYSELVQTKTLNKLKTREKKFKPIADHVNSIHHLIKPATFPFKWTWRDVSVKIQNMRHQFLGVKVKMRGEGEREGEGLGLGDGNDYWDNFGLYREVFGDLEIESGSEDGEEDGEGTEIVKMREEVLRREERRRDREDERLRASAECATVRDTLNLRPDPDLEMKWQKREMERRSRVERELRRRREVEERWEEEEMGWRERVFGMQLEHERQMMQMHSEFCHNQMQIIGTMARLVSQFFGAANDGLGVLPPHQVLGSLQHHSGGLGGDGKLDSDSPSEFL